jgi:hypothetical protein
MMRPGLSAAKARKKHSAAELMRLLRRRYIESGVRSSNWR